MGVPGHRRVSILTGFCLGGRGWGGGGGAKTGCTAEYYVHDQQRQICRQKFTEFAVIQQNIKQHIWFTENNIQAWTKIIWQTKAQAQELKSLDTQKHRHKSDQLVCVLLSTFC